MEASRAAHPGRWCTCPRASSGRARAGAATPGRKRPAGWTPPRPTPPAGSRGHPSPGTSRRCSCPPHGCLLQRTVQAVRAAVRRSKAMLPCRRLQGTRLCCPGPAAQGSALPQGPSQHEACRQLIHVKSICITFKADLQAGRHRQRPRRRRVLELGVRRPQPLFEFARRHFKSCCATGDCTSRSSVASIANLRVGRRRQRVRQRHCGCAGIRGAVAPAPAARPAGLPGRLRKTPRSQPAGCRPAARWSCPSSRCLLRHGRWTVGARLS